MEKARIVLDIFEKKVHVYSQLISALQSQKQFLVDYDVTKINQAAAWQITCIEKIRACETVWNNFVSEIFPENRPADFLKYLPGKLNFTKKEYGNFNRLQARLRELLREVETLKETNKFLLKESLMFVNALVRNIGASVSDPGVYHPDKKKLCTKSLMNRMM